MTRVVCSLALSLLVTSAATGQGAAFLPDTTHNVGVGEILAPRGSVDSGLPLVPRIIVNNYGTATETLWTFMRIGAYLDSAEVIGLPGRGSDSVSFSSWTPAGRDSMTAVSWTVCARDSFPEDDTARVRFLVRVSGVGLVILWPVGGLDSGLVVYPEAEVWNYGNQTVSGHVQFRIGQGYASAAPVPNLIPGGRRQVFAPDSWVAQPGQWLLVDSLVVTHPCTTVVWDSATFQVRGMPQRGVGVPWIYAGGDTFDTLTLVTVRCTVANVGQSAEQFWTSLRVWDTVRTVHSDSIQLMLGPGGRILLSFGSTRFTTLGMHVARCSVRASPPCSTDFRDDTFWIVAGQGVQEAMNGERGEIRSGPTLVRGVLFLPEADGEGRVADGVLLAVTGRAVMALRPGANDVRHLPSGVYFLRMASGEGRTANSKVVIQR